jgi:hypothetical protein
VVLVLPQLSGALIALISGIFNIQTSIAEKSAVKRQKRDSF